MPLPRSDETPPLHDCLRRYCRIQYGEVWEDPDGRHRIGCLDAASGRDVRRLMDGEKSALAAHDPPYNLVAFGKREIGDSIDWCRDWIANTETALDEDGSLYVWMGADQNAGFQPLPDFMITMRDTPFRPRSFLTVRNQRGYGTQKNWMAVRQELLY